MIDTRNIQPDETLTIGGPYKIPIPRGFDVADTTANVHGKLKNTGAGFALGAQGQTQLAMRCSRCLMPLDVQISFIINETFAPQDIATDEEIGFADYQIDLIPAIKRNLLADIPMKPLCDDDCAGLCKACGKNLNQEDCQCDGEIINEQFRELLQMFDD